MLRRTFLAQCALALERGRLDQAIAMSKKAAQEGVEWLAGAARQGTDTTTWSAGKAKPDTVFLLASITKPMTAIAVMTLVARKELTLADRVDKFIPEFRGGDRAKITVRHLLTHTSGLPDMLPENEALRKKHAPLSEFVAGTCKVPLLFAPGTQVKYQSMGILLAAEIVERVTRKPLRDYLQTSLFQPLGMKNASLGMGGRRISDTAQCQVPATDDWHWNSTYWRNLGAPWGGAHANTDDILRMLGYFLQPDARLFEPAVARQMVTNQNEGLNDPWGLGFMVNGARFAKQCSKNTFGHWGSTGTIAWADPVSGASFVLLTTRPASDSRGTVLGPVSDAVAQAVSKA